ncbi:unnamed protein product [Caenorhabditis brenneri]
MYADISILSTCMLSLSLTCKDLSWLVSEMKIEIEEVHLHFDKKDIEFTVYKGRERLKIKMFNYFKDPKLAPHPSDRQLTVFHNTGVTSAPTVCWNMEGFGFQLFLRRLKSVNQAPVINIAFTHLQKPEYRRIMNVLLEFIAKLSSYFRQLVFGNNADANKEENELHEVNAQDFQNFLEGSHVKDVIDEDTAYEATLEVMNKRNMVVWNALFGGLGNRIPKKLRLVQ